MCEHCLATGKMTQKEFETWKMEGKELVKHILSLLEGKEEALVMNTLLSCVINTSIDLDIPPLEIIMALASGFKLLTIPNFGKETLN